MKPQLITLLISISLVFQVSCSDKSNLSKEDQKLIEIYKLIDTGKALDAVSMSDSALKTEKKPAAIYSLKVAQSSAYAKLSGFSFKKLNHVVAALIDLASSKKKHLAYKETFEKYERQKKKLLKNGTREEKEKALALYKENTLAHRTNLFSSTVDVFSSYVKILIGAPSISEENLVFLDQSILILDELEDSILPEDSIFRALLKALKAKHSFENEMAANTNDDKCSIGLTSIYNSLLKNQDGLDAILSDLAIARPSSATDIKNFRIQLRNSYEALTLSKSVLNLMKDVSKDSFLKNNLDEVFKTDCLNI